VISQPSTQYNWTASNFYIDEKSKLLYLILSPGKYYTGGKPIILEAINLENVTEKSQISIEGGLVSSQFPLTLQSVFIGKDGLIRIVTGINDALRPQDSDYEYAFTTIDPLDGSIVDEYKTDLRLGMGAVFFDGNNNKVYIPSGNRYIVFDFINKEVVDEIDGSIINENIRSFPYLTMDDDSLYFVYKSEKDSKINVIDKKDINKMKSFETGQEIHRFNSAIGVDNGILYVAKDRELFVYNQQGELIRKISLK